MSVSNASSPPMRTQFTIYLAFLKASLRSVVAEIFTGILLASRSLWHSALVYSRLSALISVKVTSMS